MDEFSAKAGVEKGLGNAHQATPHHEAEVADSILLHLPKVLLTNSNVTLRQVPNQPEATKFLSHKCRSLWESHCSV